MADRVPPADPDDWRVVARHIAEMSDTLAGMARRHGLKSLSHLLDIAHLEATSLTKEPDDKASDASG